MDEAAIKAVLMPYLKSVRVGTVTDELSIGRTIVDVAVLSTYIEAFEIKGDTDGLNSARARKQYADYSENCRWSWVVVSDKPGRREKAESSAPRHWGIMVVSPSTVCVVRPTLLSPTLNKLAVLHNLWKDEVVELLAERKVAKFRKLNKDTQVGILSDLIDLEDAERVVAKSFAESTLRMRNRRTPLTGATRKEERESHANHK